MATGGVYFNGVLAGYLQKPRPGVYRFVYDEAFRNDPATPAICLAMPKSRPEYDSPYLFPFFAGLLSEGINKEIQCRLLKIDEADDFTRLLKTAGEDTIGAITVKEIPAP